jgi:hypothetical protein
VRNSAGLNGSSREAVGALQEAAFSALIGSTAIQMRVLHARLAPSGAGFSICKGGFIPLPCRIVKVKIE